MSVFEYSIGQWKWSALRLYLDIHVRAFHTYDVEIYFDEELLRSGIAETRIFSNIKYHQNIGIAVRSV